MSTQPKSRSERLAIVHDDSGSMILALFVIMILTALVSVVLMATISQQAKTRKATDFTFAGQAADTAVNDALFMANNYHPDASTSAADPNDPAFIGHWDNLPAENPKVHDGTTGEFYWYWYATEVVGTNPSWAVTATGCRNKNTDPAPPECTSSSKRTMKAVLTSTIVDPLATGASMGSSFTVEPGSGFGRALFADTDLNLRGSVTVTSYASVAPDPDAMPDVNTGKHGEVGTNGLATFETAGTKVGLPDGKSPTTWAGIFMSNVQAGSSGERCSSLDRTNHLQQECDITQIHDIQSALKIDDITSLQDKLDNCPAGEQLAPWVSSDAPTPGHLELPPRSSYLCFSSLTFDVDTVVDGAGADSATMVYVSGPVTVSPGVKVNRPPGIPLAHLLQIFTTGDVVSIGGGDSAATITEAAWALWAPKASCSVNPEAGFTSIYGAMVCQKISTQGTFTASWDESLGVRATAIQDDQVAVWDIAGYQEVTAP